MRKHAGRREHSLPESLGQLTSNRTLLAEVAGPEGVDVYSFASSILNVLRSPSKSTVLRWMHWAFAGLRSEIITQSFAFNSTVCAKSFTKYANGGANPYCDNARDPFPSGP
jgi:hypothetical protein